MATTRMTSNTVFSEECEVLQSIYGDILSTTSHSVTVVLSEYGIRAHFEIPREYPDQSPVLTLRWVGQAPEAMVHDQLATIASLVEQSSTEHLGSTHVFQMLETLKSLAADLEDLVNYIAPGETSFSVSPPINRGASARSSRGQPQQSTSDATTPTTKTKSSKAHKHKTATDEQSSKKVSMRTSADVVDRIRWDKDIDKELMIVGYEDRFLGIMEKPFNAFNWSDLASLSHMETAIPKHRIVYFKYLGRIVWDKRVRLDDVYGSQGGLRMHEVLAELAAVAAAPRNTDPAVDTGATTTTNNNNHNGDDNTAQSESDEFSESEHEGDDDDTTSDQATSAHFRGPRGRQPQRGPRHAPGQRPPRETDNSDRPNYFICLPINHPSIRFAAQRVQDSVVQYEPRLASACLPLSALHLTLLTMRLENDAEIAQASAALQQCQELLVSHLPPWRALTFRGLGIFRDRVLFAELLPQHERILSSLVTRMTQVLTAANVRLVGNFREFKAHATLVKLSRALCRELHHIPTGAYMPLQSTEFGDQRVEAMHLCRMVADKADDGFYFRLASVPNALPAVTSTSFLADVESKLTAGDSKITPVVVIMRGLAGSGKSTLAAALLALSPSHALCSADAFFSSHGQQYLREASRIAEAHEFCHQQFTSAVASGVHVVVVDNTNSQLREYSSYVEQASRAHYRVIIAEIQCTSREQVEVFHARNTHAVLLDACYAMHERWEFDPKATLIHASATASNAATNVSSTASLPTASSETTASTPAIAQERNQTSAPHRSFSSSIVYAAVFLEPSSRQTLLSLFPAVHDKEHADHLTLCYRPSSSVAALLPVGAAVSLRVVCERRDELAQAVEVEIADQSLLHLSTNAWPHITISTSGDTPAQYSNELIANERASDAHAVHAPSEPTMLVGKVGVVLSSLSESRVVRISDRLEFMRHAASIQAPADAPTYTSDDAGMVTCLHVFDFDGTLCQTYDRDAGMWEYQRLTGRAWPFKQYFSQPESLQYPMPALHGPALSVFRTFAGRRNTKTVILTGRAEATRAALSQVLAELGIAADLIVMKPEADQDITLFKLGSLRALAAQYPSVTEIKVWEDDEALLAEFALLKDALKAAQPRPISLKIADAVDLSGKLSDSLRSENSSIRSWLRRAGHLRNDDDALGAQTGVNLVVQCWIECLQLVGLCLNCDATDSALVPRFAHHFGSHSLGRRSDVDLCLLAPGHVSAWQHLTTLAAQLRTHGVTYIYMANSERCPRLKIQLRFPKCGPIEFDVVMALLPKRSFETSVAASLSTLDALASQPGLDEASRTALAGPVFLRDFKLNLAAHGIPAIDVANLLEFLKQSLANSNLAGNTFHCPRTYHWMVLLDDFVRSLATTPASPPNVDLLFIRFIQYCAGLSAQQFALKFLAFVPQQFVPPIQAYFRTVASLFVGPGSPVTDPVSFRLPTDVIKSLFSRKPFPSRSGLHDCVIRAVCEDDVLAWQLETFMRARFPTYLRRLVEDRGISVFEACSSSESLPLTIRFAVPAIADAGIAMSSCFKGLWTELSAYTNGHASFSATMAGVDFCETSSVLEALTAELDSEVVSMVRTYAASSSTEPFHLPHTLNGSDRAVVHNLAESLGLAHASEGSGHSRHIVLRRR